MRKQDFKGFTRRIITLMAFAAITVTGATTSVSASEEAAVPDYYPADYSKIIDASREEKGLLIYGNVAEYNWRPILEGFKKKYPWIKTQTLDLGPAIAFERYYSETSVDKRSADMFAVASPDSWMRLIDKGGLVTYQSPEIDHLPAWSAPFPGLYTIATDPMVIIYNKFLVEEDDRPDSMEDLVELAEDDPEKYHDRMTTYDATSHPFAYSIYWSMARYLGEDAWPVFDLLGGMTRPEAGGSTMVEKVTSGEYYLGYFVSGITVFPRMKQAGRSKILGWSLIEDGTPVFHRNIGVTTKAHSPNSAKLLVDYILSHEGQVEVGKGGMTPYRADVSDDEVPYMTYRMIAEKIGEDNIVHVDFDEESDPGRDAFLERWKAAYRNVVDD